MPGEIRGPGGRVLLSHAVPVKPLPVPDLPLPSAVA